MKPDRANLMCRLIDVRDFIGRIIAHLTLEMPRSLIMQGNYTVSQDDSAP